MEFENKTVVITGATGGIGSETAKAFAEEGANLVLVDLNKDKLDALKKSLGIDENRIVTVVADVTNETQVEGYVAAAEKAFGKIDVFFNNAGLLSTGYIEDLDISEIQKIWGVNVFGVILGLKHVIRSMKKSGGGSIINTGSVDSYGADAGNSMYAASKHAVYGISKCAALETAAHNIRVNTICPGPVHTSMIDTYVNEQFPGETVQSVYGVKMPMGRIAEPRDIANAVLFLAGEKSAYISGTRLAIDGAYKHR